MLRQQGICQPPLASDFRVHYAASSISQEERTFAALNHVFIYFSTIGIIVSLVVQVTQRGKSAQVSVRSLQVAIWQLISSLFAFLTTLRLVALILAPAPP